MLVRPVFSDRGGLTSVSSSFLQGCGSRVLKAGSGPGSPGEVGLRGFLLPGLSPGALPSAGCHADTWCPQGVTGGCPPPSVFVSLEGMGSFFKKKICLFTNSFGCSRSSLYTDFVASGGFLSRRPAFPLQHLILWLSTGSRGCGLQELWLMGSPEQGSVAVARGLIALGDVGSSQTRD